MSLTSAHHVVLLTLLGYASGCGPEIEHGTDLVSGYYRATWIESDDGAATGVWSTDMAVGFSPDTFEALYADLVPVRAGADFLEVPEPAAALEGQVFVEPHWRMRRLSWTGSGFEAEEAFAISFCRSYRFTWSAAEVDDTTIHVTREGTGCGPGDGSSRIDDNHLEIEYALVDPCEPPCAFVDDRETLFPGAELDDVILRDSRCTC